MFVEGWKEVEGLEYVLLLLGVGYRVEEGEIGKLLYVYSRF